MVTVNFEPGVFRDLAASLVCLVGPGQAGISGTRRIWGCLQLFVAGFFVGFSFLWLAQQKTIFFALIGVPY